MTAIDQSKNMPAQNRVKTANTTQAMQTKPIQNSIPWVIKR